MELKFQPLVNKILENMNVAGVPGAFGNTGNLMTDPDVKTAMAITGGGVKRSKKKKAPKVFKRTFPKTGGL